jgi:hypothetical protein
MSRTIKDFVDYNLPKKHTNDVGAILKSLAIRIGEEDSLDGDDLNLTYLGRGHFAEVYWLEDKRKVLKLTKDKNDANACAILQRKPAKSLLKVYDVFKVTPDNKTIYGIISEKLTPLSSSQSEHFSLFTGFLDYWFGGNIATFFPTLSQIREAENRDPEKWKRWCTRYKITEKYLDLLKEWAKALESRNIRWGDYKEENILNRGNTPVISDLGYSKVTTQRLPSLNLSFL